MDARRIAKQGLFGGARLLGANRILRRRTRDRLLVLCYHGVVSDDHRDDELRHSTTVSRAEFAEQLRILEESFHCVSGEQVRRWLEGSQDLPPSPVLITFDDGFRNTLTNAAPLLASRSIPAVVFVASGYIGDSKLLWPQELAERVLQWKGTSIPVPAADSNAFAEVPLPEGADERRAVAEHIKRLCKTLPETPLAAYLEHLRTQQGELQSLDRELYDFLDWDEVRELHRQGIEIGSHSVSHPILSQVSPERLESELGKSKAKIETELGTSCELFAYPNGSHDDYNEDVVDALRKAGYSLGFTLNRALNDRDCNPFLIDRMDVPGHVPLEVFRARIAGVFSLLDALRSH